MTDKLFRVEVRLMGGRDHTEWHYLKVPGDRMVAMEDALAHFQLGLNAAPPVPPGSTAPRLSVLSLLAEVREQEDLGPRNPPGRGEGHESPAYGRLFTSAQLVWYNVPPEAYAVFVARLQVALAPFEAFEIKAV